MHQGNQNDELKEIMMEKNSVTSNILNYVLTSKEIDKFWEYFENYWKINKDESLKDFCKCHPNEIDVVLGIQNFTLNYSRMEDRGFSYNIRMIKSTLISFLKVVVKKEFEKIKKVKKKQSKLPIFEWKNYFLENIAQSNVLTVQGSPGCGKSTQIPQFLLLDNVKSIALVCNNEISCYLNFRRILRELFGTSSHAILTNENAFPDEYYTDSLRVLTANALLRKYQNDPLLTEYDVIIVDDFHLKEAYQEYLVGVASKILHTRTQFKLIVTSADTKAIPFNLQQFVCKSLRINSKKFPVEVIYCENLSDKPIFSEKYKFDPSPYVRLMKALDTKYRRDQYGDLLVFLSNEADIGKLIKGANNYASSFKWIFLSFYQDMSVETLNKAFNKVTGFRRCYIATDIVHSTLTLKNLSFVCDSGMAYEQKCLAATNSINFAPIPVSKLEAKLRKGRVGRTEPGICFRFYGKHNYEAFQDSKANQLSRMSVDIIGHGLMKYLYKEEYVISRLGFLSEIKVKECLEKLNELNLIENNDLTRKAKVLRRLPLDDKPSEILLNGICFGQIYESVIAASLLCIGSPFVSNLIKLTGKILNNGAISENTSVFFTSDILFLLFIIWLCVMMKMDLGKEDYFRFLRMYKLRDDKLEKIVNLSESVMGNLISGCLGKVIDGNEDKFQVWERILKKEGCPRKIGSEKDKVSLAEIFYHYDEYGDKNESLDCELLLKLNTKVEFLQKSINEQDYVVLLVSLCISLYPNYAIPMSSPNNEAVRHNYLMTKKMTHILFHPSSIFSKHKSVADLNQKFENQPNIFFYSSLISTRANYMVNSCKLPAIFSLFITALLKCSFSFRRIVVDEWLSINFDCPLEAINYLTSCIQIRRSLERLNELQETITSISSKDSQLQILQDEMNTITISLQRRVHELIDKKVDATIASLDETHVTESKSQKSIKINYELFVSSDLHQKLQNTGAFYEDTRPEFIEYKIKPYLIICYMEDTNDNLEPYSAKFVCPLCKEDSERKVVDFIYHASHCPLNFQ